MKAVSVTDYRELARRRLPHFLFEYIDGGSYAEVTQRRNIADLEQVTLRQRVMRGVSTLDTSTTLFGQHMAMPVMLGPVGLAGMNARRGEVQAAQAAKAARAPFVLSTVSVCTLHEVNKAVGDPVWFQLYMIKDRGFMRELLTLAKEQGTPALIFTVDLTIPGARYRDFRSGLSGADNLFGSIRRGWQAAARPRWAWNVGLRGRPHVLGNLVPAMTDKSRMGDFMAWLRDNVDPSVTWRDLDFIRENWDGPLIIKGVLEPSDARDAASFGADGLVVSNHGGRQLDGVLSTARALPPIAEAVGERLTVLADGGVRSGLDVVRMLSLGAKGVLLGRAWSFALAANGKSGVADMLSMIKAELQVAMALMGVDRVEQITREISQSKSAFLREGRDERE